MDLILFYENGRTFRFEDVTGLEIKGDTATFNYFGRSTQRQRAARFEGFVGHSVVVQKNKEQLMKGASQDLLMPAT